MSRPYDPGRGRPAWAPAPVPCEDCATLLDPNGWSGSGRQPSVCRTCQNKRYEAKLAGTAQGERRRRRKALRSKKRRLETRIARDQAQLAAALVELGELAGRATGD